MTIFQTILIGLALTIMSCDNCKTDKQDKKDNQSKPETKITSIADSIEIRYPSLWVYGMIQPKDDQRRIVASWYHFRFSIKGGCTTPQAEGTGEHNRKTDSILTARIGKDWRERFEKSVDSLYSIDSLAIAIAHADSYIQNFDTITEKHNDKYNFYPNLRYTCHPTSDDNIKVVNVNGYGIVYNKVGQFHYLTATVDLKKKKVININKTAFGW